MSDVYGTSIDDGITSKSKNNILVFPDWDTFKQASIDLEKQREIAIEIEFYSRDITEI